MTFFLLMPKKTLEQVPVSSYFDLFQYVISKIEKFYAPGNARQAIFGVDARIWLFNRLILQYNFR